MQKGEEKEEIQDKGEQIITSIKKQNDNNINVSNTKICCINSSKYIMIIFGMLEILLFLILMFKFKTKYYYTHENYYNIY